MKVKTEQSPQELYQERLKRVHDAIQLKVPDRVPLVLSTHFFPTNRAGIPAREAMFDYDRLESAWKSFTLDTLPDMHHNPYGSIGIGALLEALDVRQYRWPGHGVAPNLTYQFVEAEHMAASDYEAFLFDPSDYVLRRHLPRVCGALEPLKLLPRMASLDTFHALGPISAFLNNPEATRMMGTLAKALAAEEVRRDRSQRFAEEMKLLGFPPSQQGRCHAPFDYIGDYFRGTTGIMLDMYRNADKLLQALDKVLAITIEATVSALEGAEKPLVHIPLHKGAEGFMSLKQFQTFYWPTLRALIAALIDHGIVPFVFVEGYYDSRLEIIGDIPRGKAIYKFEHTNLFRAKEVLGDRVCIRGNVPASMLCTGTPQEVRDYCKKLINVVGKDGGFIMDGAVGIPDEAKWENVKAMADTTHEYGVYG